MKRSDVVEIRRMVREGVTYRAVARVFGISHGTVGSIARREGWRHVDG